MRLDAKQIKQFDEEGWLFLPDCFPPGEVAALRTEAEGIYALDRPQIWRDYKTNGCEYDDRGVHQRNFDMQEQLWEYAESIQQPRRPASRTSAGDATELQD